MKRLTTILVTVAMMAILTLIGAPYAGAQDASTKAQSDAHVKLGVALGNKGDWNGQAAEEREALRLNPNNGQAHVSLGIALYNKGDLDGAITEQREALRSNPNNAEAHVNLGTALGNKGDLDGAIAEFREALRLNPNHALAHAKLGVRLKQKGDLQGALKEYHAACMLEPKNTTYKQAYENLLHKMEPNKDSGTNSEIYSVGGSVSAPIPVYKPEPTYTEEARKAKYQGTIVLWIVVDSQGNVTDCRVAKPLGLGLDEKAVETVRTWKFKPALRNGVPVSVRATVEVSFRL